MLIDCPICDNTSYNKDTNCCDVCGFDGLVWSQAEYENFFEFEQLEDIEDSFFYRYAITEINDPLDDLPTPFSFPSRYQYGIVTELKDDLFYGDTRLSHVIIPSTIEIIGANAFSECSYLEHLSILGGTYIANRAFEDCFRLSDLDLGTNISIIGYRAFSGCTSLQTLVIPKSVKRIGHHAFQGCTKLKNVIITNPDIIIENTAFISCPNISSVTIPSSLAGRIHTLFDNPDNIINISWIDHNPNVDYKRVLSIDFNDISKDSYTSGREGHTVSFSITNNNNSSITVSVSDIILVSENGIMSSDSWLSDHNIDDQTLAPGESCEAAAIFFSDNFDDSCFENGALICVKTIHSIAIHDNMDTSEILDLYDSDGDGDYSRLLDLPYVGSHSTVFKNFDNRWLLVATSLPEKSYDMEYLEIEFANFVVRANSFNCNSNHDVETVEAYVNILADDGSIFKASTIAGYCRHCKCYFILEADFRNLQRKGKLLCQLLSWEEYRTKGHAIFNGEDMKAESVLKRCGYNVNATENLSSIQRQKILSLVLENGLYTETELCNFLDWLISYHGRSRTRNMSSAISKWSEDRLFVQSHNWEERRKVKIRKISYK